MASRGSGPLTRGRLVGTSFSLLLALLGCGKSSLTIRPADAGPDGSVGALGGEGGATAAAGGTQGLGGSLFVGPSSAVDAASGGTSTAGASSAVAGTASSSSVTGGSIRTGGTTASLTGTAGRGGAKSGGATATAGVTGTGGTGGRATLGGSTVLSTAGRTSTGGTSAYAGTAAGSKGSTGGPSTGGTTSGGTGGGTGGTGGTGGSSIPAALFQPLIEAFCTAAKSCCARESYQAADLADCESQFLTRWDSYPLLGKGTVLLDQNALAACTSAYKLAATACTINSVKAACKGVFAGLQAEGQACGGTSKFGCFECKPINGSAACYRPQGNTDPKSPGTCVSIPRGKAGDACSMTCQKGETCMVDMVGGSVPFPATCFEEDGLYCALATNPPICKALVPVGGVCQWGGNPCGSGKACNWGPTSTCVTASLTGESCLERICAEDLVCGESHICLEKPFASDSVCKGAPPTP